LLDVLVPAIDASRSDALAHLVVQHPLQAFDVRGFQPASDIRLRSFHGEYAAALAAGQAAMPSQVSALVADGDGADADGDLETDETIHQADEGADEAEPDTAAAPAFFTQPLPAPAPAPVTLVQLQRFFRHPARALLQRLGVTLRQPDETLADDEPFLADFPARQDLADRLLPTLLQAAEHGQVVPDATLLALAQAGTQLPGGPVGVQVAEAELPLLRAHAQALADAGRAPLLPPHSASLPFTIDVDGTVQPWPLGITLTGLRADGLLLHRYDDPRAGDHLQAWLAHLALCACAPAGVAGRTRWLGRGASFGFRPVDDPLPLLQQLLGLWVQGQRQPLPFLPKTAWAWMAGSRSLGAARGAWLASDRRPFAEQADAAHRLVWRGRPDPLDGGLADFETVSALVLEPLFAHLDDGAAA